MAVIEGNPEEILTRVQALVEQHLPGVVCELQEYKTQIGCGVLDERGTLHEVKWRVRGVTEFNVDGQARALASRFKPMLALHRRG